MTLFLTSSPCVIGAPKAILNPANGFIDNLREALPQWPRVLFVCSDPENHDMTCGFANDMLEALRDVGIPCGGFMVLDGCNADEAAFLVAISDLIILSGGHVPTQNRFFQDICLRELLIDYPGVVMGISAGSMNCADEVYAQPEEPGESIDPEYERFLPGLGLTDANILPHYQQVKDNILDGVRLYEDITFGDSMGRKFYVLPDGSYLLQSEEGAAIFGEAYCLSDGILEWLSGEDECREL